MDTGGADKGRGGGKLKQKAIQRPVPWTRMQELEMASVVFILKSHSLA